MIRADQRGAESGGEWITVERRGRKLASAPDVHAIRRSLAIVGRIAVHGDARSTSEQGRAMALVSVGVARAREILRVEFIAACELAWREVADASRYHRFIISMSC